MESILFRYGCTVAGRLMWVLPVSHLPESEGTDGNGSISCVLIFQVAAVPLFVWTLTFTVIGIEEFCLAGCPRCTNVCDRKSHE